MHRWHKGASTAGAEREQRLAREQSAKQFAETMAFQRQQYAAAQSIKPAVYAPPAPLATGDPDVYNAGLDAKRSQIRRFGVAKTRLASAPQASAITMGGGASIAA